MPNEMEINKFLVAMPIKIFWVRAVISVQFVEELLLTTLELVNRVIAILTNTQLAVLAKAINFHAN